MSDLLASVGNFFGSGAGKGLETLAGLGTAGAGLLGNISAEQQAQKEENFLTGQQNQIAALTPQKLSQMATSAAAPLDAGLVQAVENQVGGNLASQGLAQSPGIAAASESQALAPYEQTNINTALNAILTKLGLPSQIAGTALAGMPKPTNLSPLLALLMKGGSSGGTQPSPSLTGGGEQDFLNLLFPPTGSGSDAGATQGDFDNLNFDLVPV
jgi:hypothetical protein